MKKFCQICGASYDYCPTCKDLKYKEVVDNPVCYTVYNVLYEYRTGIIDKKKASEKLRSVRINKYNIDRVTKIASVRDKILEILNR